MIVQYIIHGLLEKRSDNKTIAVEIENTKLIIQLHVTEIGNEHVGLSANW